MHRRSLLPALLAIAAATSALPAEPNLADRTWARFEDSAGPAPSHPIVASDVPGDAALSSLDVQGGLLVVTGTLGTDHGSRWTTLGAEISPSAGPGAVDLRGSTALRIRLASAVPRMLRVRLKGGDPRIANAGCYPVVIQQATPTPVDYTIPLAAFGTPGWCGANAATVEQTLPAVERVEVTANDAPAGAVDFRVGRIDFLAEPPVAEPDGRWHLAWGDDFDGAPGASPSPARWQTEGDVVQDGRGHLALHARMRSDGKPARAVLHATAANALVYGRIDVRLRLPASAGGAPGAALRLALQATVGDAGAIVLLEGEPGGGALAAGLDAAGGRARATHIRAALPMPPDGGFHTVSCEWEPDRIRWFVDGALVQERQRADELATTWNAFAQRPLALELSVRPDGDGRAGTDDTGAALLIDAVQVWQRDDLAAAAATGPVPVRGSVVAAAARRRAAPGSPPAAAASAPSRHVVCEHSTRYELMLCY
ncbi:MAG: family 16 glycosylhydrolase [Vitreoscilla sp.]